MLVLWISYVNVGGHAFIHLGHCSPHWVVVSSALTRSHCSGMGYQYMYQDINRQLR